MTAAGDPPAVSSASSRRGLGETAACRTALVTTSETSRQASFACSGSSPQLISCAGPTGVPATP